MSHDNVSGNVNGDLISREWVLKEIRAHKAYAQSFRQVTYGTGYICGLAVLEGRLADAPAVDAAPVVHARWVWADDGYCRCSNCTQKAPVVTQYQDEPTTTMTDYCPNCGAKMDLEEVPKDV